MKLLSKKKIIWRIMSSPMEVCKSDMYDKLRNRTATLRGCVRRVAAQDREGTPGQATIGSVPALAMPDRMMLSYTPPMGLSQG